MQQVLTPLVPMLLAAGAFRVGSEVIAAVVDNRFLRGVLLMAAFAVWGTWHASYMMNALAAL